MQLREARARARAADGDEGASGAVGEDGGERAARRAGAVADPYHVRRQVVVVGADRARERLLEVELHRLVRREDALVAAMGGGGCSENCKESWQRIAPNGAELRARTERIVWKMVSSVGISRFAFFSCLRMVIWRWDRCAFVEVTAFPPSNLTVAIWPPSDCFLR